LDNKVFDMSDMFLLKNGLKKEML